MAYVPVPKDLTKVKTKFLFNLTRRQVVCFGIGALLGVPIFFLVRGTLGISPAVLLMMLVMLPFFLLAMYEHNGQPLEVLLQNYVQARFRRPPLRPYQTDNFYSAIDQQVRYQQEVNQILYGKEQET